MSTYVGDVMMPWPMKRVYTIISTSTAVATVDADTEKIACVFQAPKTGSIEYVGLGIGAVATTPGANVDIRIETVTTSTGEPSGTLFDTNTNYGWDMSGASTYALNKIGPLTSNASVSQGDLFAVVYVPPSSPNQGDVDFVGYEDETYGFPYCRFYNGSAWVTTTARIKCVLYYTDGIAMVPANIGSSATYLHSFNSGSTYNHVGVQMKSSVGLSVVGMWAFVDLDTDSTFKLISGTDTVERSCSLESDYRQAAAERLHYGYFSSAFGVAADTAYRYVIAPGSITNIGLKSLRCLAAGESSITIKNSQEANPFYDPVNQQGELTTPTWTGLTGGGTGAWPLIGPIVRSIG